ncbi:N-acyl-D-amino-acid deacylase family protein [Streptacidiphilus carbonis]|jgi:N-acyl-D-amino-acid deacylase|uniref:N-acyl-D-amino-acid deacylase family protein n=1 Tax=Streptacidiphilus carbonis TaxID=105422 RepID=UPI0005AABE16|nr:D-aminoacylase [Streptacidiphilus carbonis]
MARQVLVRGALVVDGSGGTPYRADTLVRDGRIALIHRETDPGPRPGTDPDGRTVDADGLALTPGFIDMHAHSDLALLTDPAHLAKAAQGVTLEVLGQDGLSYAPVDAATLAGLRVQLAGWNGDPEGLDWSWRSVGEYLDRLDAGPQGGGLAVNAAYLVPHGTLRALVLGWEDRAATVNELELMNRQLDQALAEGAVGLSAGLSYSPGMYADTAELVSLCRTVAARGGYFCPHHRSYGANALAAYAEMTEVARQSGCGLHLAHATMNFQVNAGRAGELLHLLDTAIAEGVDLTLDSYPYLPGSTTLAALLPGWATAGGPEETLRRLADPAALTEIRAALEQHGSDGCHGVVADWDTVQVSGVRNPALRSAVGLTVARLAARDGTDPFSAYVRLLREDGLGTTVLQHVGHEENVRAIMRHPAHTGGSDGLLVGDRPHPRAWGTFPRYLGHYVRSEGVLGLAECVRHLTGRPARRLGLADRGLVREGYRADLVLLDPQTVDAGAGYERPRTAPSGIPYVLVDGVPVVDDHRRTDATPGRSVRRSGTAIS